MGDFHKVAKISEILDGEIKAFIVDNLPIVICNRNNNFYAFRDECSHEAFPLSDGYFEGDNIACNYHGAEFDIKTGEALCLPAIEPIDVYEVKIDGDEILVKID
ncbi:MAG: Rieske (2Fe-2S) protein [Thermodesulfobacteriota bacterium]